MLKRRHPNLLEVTIMMKWLMVINLIIIAWTTESTNDEPLLPRYDDEDDEDKPIRDDSLVEMPKLNTAIKVEVEVNDTREKETILSPVPKPAPVLLVPTIPKLYSKSSSPLPKPHKVKRKAEYLSKESVKVGATTTSSVTMSESKVPKLQSPTNFNNNTTNSNLPLVPVTQDSGRSTKRKSSKHVFSTVLPNPNCQKTARMPEKQHLTLTAILQSTPTSGVKSRDTLAAAAPISSRTSREPVRPQEDAATVVTQEVGGQHQVLHTASVAETPTHRLQHMTIPVNPGPEYWLTRYPVVNNVFITDVTVNLNTVTIKECKTDKGFFKSSVERRL